MTLVTFTSLPVSFLAEETVEFAQSGRGLFVCPNIEMGVVALSHDSVAIRNI